MALFCLCALAGAYSLQFCSELPGPAWLGVLAVASLSAILVRRFRLVGAFLSGFLILAIASQSVIDDRLNPDISGDSIRIDARVTDFPKNNGASFSFQVSPVGRDDLPQPVNTEKARIRASHKRRRGSSIRVVEWHHPWGRAAIRGISS